MVAAKVFLLTFHIHVHNVYCRGARPRPWGPIRLLAVTSHSHAETRPLLPAFPLLVKEDLIFKQNHANIPSEHNCLSITHSPTRSLKSDKLWIFQHEVVQCGSDLRALEQHLKKEWLKLQLVQGQGDILLAQLTTSLARVLFPRHPLKWLRDGVEMELVMTPTPRFQSAIGPRVELSTRLVIDYCPEEKVKVIDLNPGNNCACLNQDFFMQSNGPCQCKSLNEAWAGLEQNQKGYGCAHPLSAHAMGSYQCDICEAYNLLVRKRFSEDDESSPWARRHV